MTTQWETVRIFISSTFEDMHAERDYLVKQVFPELREWCERRRLNLVDIDLRWGVKEEDTRNRNVVDVCLRRIDDARPFFLCFLGQRRGWIPRQEDISPATLAPDAFPDLQESIGSASVTEMEILHALVNPFHRSRLSHDPDPERYEPVKHAFFFLRDPSYLNEMPSDFPDLQKVYTNAGQASPQDAAAADRQLEKWRSEEIPALCDRRGNPLHHYHAHWNSQVISPEMNLPMECSSLLPANRQRWQERWAAAGVQTGESMIAEPAQIDRAREYNRKRTAGRLTNFQADGQPLSQVILADLKKAIEARYPDHTDSSASASDLQAEIDQQEQFLQVCQEGFISRGDDFAGLDAYLADQGRRVMLVTAPGGMGKSTLLANWIVRLRSRNEVGRSESVHFRFIGQSDRSSNLQSLLRMLLREIKEVSGKLDEPLPDAPSRLLQEFPKLLEAAGRGGKTILVLDAINQLESGLSDLSWLPWQLPENIKLVVSLKSGDPGTDDLLSRLKDQADRIEIQPFSSLEDRRKLVKAYLSQYLKDLDDHHIDAIIQSDGAGNPLFLKVILTELRVFGAFGSLGEKIRRDFGETPLSAFDAVLKRLEEDPASTTLDPRQVVPWLFGLLAHARAGLSADELTLMLARCLNIPEHEQELSRVRESVYLFMRQVRPFLSHREGRYDFFYESFRLAARQRSLSHLDIPGWNARLAEYFHGLPTWVDENRHIPTARRAAELPWHLAMSGQAQSYKECLMTFDFLLAKVISLGVPMLMEDLKLKSLPACGLDSQSVEHLTVLERAITLSQQNLQADPLLLAGQLIARLGDLGNPALEDLLDQAGRWTKAPWIRPLTHHYNKPRSEQLAAYKGSSPGSFEVCPLPGGQELLLLSQEGSDPLRYALKRTEASSGKVIHQVALDITNSGCYAVLSPDGKRVIVQTWNTLFLFTSDSLTLEKQIPVEREQYGLHSIFIRYSPDSQYVFVVEYTPPGPQEKQRFIKGQSHLSQIRLSDGTRVRRFNFSATMKQLVFSARGKFAAACTGWPARLENPYGAEGSLSLEDYYLNNGDSSIYVMDLATFDTPGLITNTAVCDDLAFSNDEGHLVCVNEMGRIEIWNILENKRVNVMQALSEQQVAGMLPAMIRLRSQEYGRAKIVTGCNGTKALCSFESAYMATLDISDPRNVTIEQNLYHPAQVMTLKKANEELVASLSPTKELLVWKLQTGKLVGRFKDNSLMRDFWPVSLDGRALLITKNDEGTLRLWDISQLAESEVSSSPVSSAQNSHIFELKRDPQGESVCALKVMSLDFVGVASRKRMFEYRAAPPILLDFHYHPDGRQMDLIYVDGTVRTISLQNYQTLNSIKLPADLVPGKPGVQSPDGSWWIWGRKTNSLEMVNLASRQGYRFEETTPLETSQLPPPSDIITESSKTPQDRPAWGRTMLGILPGDLALSFCYLPQVYKPYPGHAGTLESTDKWLELHDLRTGKFIKKIVLPDPRPVVLKAKISNIDGQVYLLTARTEYEYGPADFKYYLEKLDIEKESSQVLVSRDSAIKDFSLFDDEACAVLVESDGELEAISLADGRVVSHFKGDFIFSSCITVQAGRIFCAGDDQGFLNFFSLENDAPAGTSPSSPPEMTTGIADSWQFTRIENAAPGPEATRPAEEIPAVPGRPKEKGGFFSNLFKK